MNPSNATILLIEDNTGDVHLIRAMLRGVRGASAVWAGAQDYLVKGRIDGALLSRSVRYAIGRHAIQGQAHRQAMAPAFPDA